MSHDFTLDRDVADEVLDTLVQGTGGMGVTDNYDTCLSFHFGGQPTVTQLARLTTNASVRIALATLYSDGSNDADDLADLVSDVEVRVEDMGRSTTLSFPNVGVDA